MRFHERIPAAEDLEETVYPHDRFAGSGVAVREAQVVVSVKQFKSVTWNYGTFHHHKVAQFWRVTTEL